MSFCGELTRRGNTVRSAPPTLGMAGRMWDRIGIMKRGELVACGTMEELRQASGRDEALEDIFLRLTGDEVARALVDVLDA